MLRGGSWNNNSANVRAANRNRNEPDNRNDNLGVRLASHGFPPVLVMGAGILRRKFSAGYGLRSEDRKPAQPVPVRARAVQRWPLRAGHIQKGPAPYPISGNRPGWRRPAGALSF